MVARDGAGNRSTASANGSFTTTSGGTGSTCDVSYVIQNEWPGGFTANLVVKNTGAATVNGWTLAFAFPAAGQAIDGAGWGATWTQTGLNMTGRDLGYNAAIAPGGTVPIGFNGKWTTSDPKPTAFTLNGTACTVS